MMYLSPLSPKPETLKTLEAKPTDCEPPRAVTLTRLSGVLGFRVSGFGFRV